MMRKLFYGVAILSGLVLTGLPAHAQTKPTYVVINLTEISDLDAYMKAVSAAEPAASQAAGGHFVIRTTQFVALDGMPPARFAMIEFPSVEKAKEWYAATKTVNDVRIKVAKSSAFIVEGMAVTK